MGTKRSLETQLSELENKVAEANENAVRGGRTALAKLESRIRELEIELGNVQAHTAENMKGNQKSERRCKELSFQIEEAEEIAALNLAKFRKAQQELEETEDRAKMAECTINELRMTRAGSFV